MEYTIWVAAAALLRSSSFHVADSHGLKIAALLSSQPGLTIIVQFSAPTNLRPCPILAALLQ